MSGKFILNAKTYNQIYSDSSGILIDLPVGNDELEEKLTSAIEALESILIWAPIGSNTHTAAKEALLKLKGTP